MTNDEFHMWRRSLKLTQAQAALELGVGKRTLEAWDRGEPGKDIPRHIELACWALSQQRAQ